MFRFIYENNSVSQSIDAQQLPNKLGLHSFSVVGYNGKFHHLVHYAQNDILILSTFCERLVSQIKNATIGIIVRAFKVEYEMSQLFSDNRGLNVKVYTIDKLRDIEVEKDVIIIACAQRADIQYFSRLNRFNKAFTRARHSVFIVGRSTYFIDDVSKIVSFFLKKKYNFLFSNRFLTVFCGIILSSMQKAKTLMLKGM